jgi:glutamate N-acetyltransferase/amino-acid N-acetyltransferase
MTTDTRKKELAVKVRLGKSVVTIGGACKGVGMIHPEMRTQKHATMLGFISTDASISKRMLEESLDEAIQDSFNMVSVDGDMSTNDTCFILANGLAGNDRITSKDKAYRKFTDALKFMASELAKMMAADGEGATKLVEIEVRGAKSADDARKVARKISTSNLLKCAIFGSDPNWGRIVAAAGASGIEFDINRTDVYLGPVKALSNGAIAKTFNKERARKFFKGKLVNISVDLKSGKSSAKAWTCDFSKEYVAINSEYST